MLDVEDQHCISLTWSDEVWLSGTCLGDPYSEVAASACPMTGPSFQLPSLAAGVSLSH